MFITQRPCDPTGEERTEHGNFIEVKSTKRALQRFVSHCKIANKAKEFLEQRLKVIVYLRDEFCSRAHDEGETVRETVVENHDAPTKL